MSDTDRHGKDANSSNYEEIRARAQAIRYLVEQRPVGMRASSGVWLRGNVSVLARDVVELTDEREVLLARVAELEAERDEFRKLCDEANEDFHRAHDYRAKAEALVRVQAEQTAALREALKTALDCRGSYNGTVSKHGGDPAICTQCEQAAREALALAEGCAAPAEDVKP